MFTSLFERCPNILMGLKAVLMLVLPEILPIHLGHTSWLWWRFFADCYFPAFLLSIVVEVHKFSLWIQTGIHLSPKHSEPSVSPFVYHKYLIVGKSDARFISAVTIALLYYAGLCESSSIQFWCGIIPVNGGGRIYPTLTAIFPTPTLHIAQFKASSSKPILLLSFSTCVFHVFFGRLRFLLPSLQITLFSKHAHHPSSTHACTISLHSPLPSEPLFPSIPTSPF